MRRKADHARDSGEEAVTKEIALAATFATVLATGRAASSRETLTVTFRTTGTGGQFAPQHCDAVWIEGARGEFVRTIGRWGKRYHKHCLAWAVEVGDINDVDGMTGATVSGHERPLTARWDMKDKSGRVVPDGTYVVRIELTDRNSTNPSVNHSFSVAFKKDGRVSRRKHRAKGFPEVLVVYSGRSQPSRPKIAPRPRPKPEPRKREPMTDERRRRSKMSLARSFELNKMFENAAKLYREIVEKYPGTPEARAAEGRLRAIEGAKAGTGGY